MNLVSDDRGVVMIQAALAIIVLLGFCAFATDYGVMWVAREQAQNAADAGALFAATSLAFDEMAPYPQEVAEKKAADFAIGTLVWGQPPTADASICYLPDPATCPTIPGLPAPEFRSFFSATVSVYRTMPTYLANMFGVSTQSVRAQATATVAPVNVARCVWPLAIPDGWSDVHPADLALDPSLCAASADSPPDPGYCNPFSKYQYPGGAELDSPDLYVAASATSGDGDVPQPTGYQLDEFALPIAATGLDPHIFADLLGPDPDTGLWKPARRSSFAAVRVGGGGFQASLTSCSPQAFHIGDRLQLDPTVSWPQVISGIDGVTGLDGGAQWDQTSSRIRGSCAVSGACGSISPRLVLVPLFDPETYDRTRGTGECNGLPCITIVNFAGFFVDDSANVSQVKGHLTTYPGRDIDTTGTFPFVGYKWAFLRTAILTR